MIWMSRVLNGSWNLSGGDAVRDVSFYNNVMQAFCTANGFLQTISIAEE